MCSENELYAHFEVRFETSAHPSHFPNDTLLDPKEMGAETRNEGIGSQRA